MENTFNNSIEQQSKRSLELGQLETRYKSTYKVIKEDDKYLCVRFAIKPTDPDFPFELNSLQLQLFIPQDYPSTPCHIQVLNSNIPKGFSINLEKGYEEHVSQSDSTLVRQMNWLDRNMEILLQQAPAPTVRFVSHPAPSNDVQQDTRSLDTRPLSESSRAQQTIPKPQRNSAPQHKVLMPQQHSKPVLPQQHSKPVLPQQHNKSVQIKVAVPPQPIVEKPPATIILYEDKFTAQEKAQANERRMKELRQLETRFCDSFKMRTSTLAVLSIDVNDVDFKYDLKPLQLKYNVPLLYPLVPCSIEIENKKLDDTRKSWVQYAFDQNTIESSLYEKLNWVNRHLQAWISTPVKIEKKSTLSITAPSFVPSTPSFAPSTSAPSTSAPSTSAPSTSAVFVPRKEEIRKNKVVVVNDSSYVVNQDSSTEESSEFSSSEESDDDSEEEKTENKIIQTERDVKRGTEIRLLQPTLDNVSLFRCTQLNVMVKCKRCKTSVEHTMKESEQTWTDCPTCSYSLGFTFFVRLVHQGIQTLGLLQLSGCVLFDILPSNFIGTCAQCMSDMASPLRIAPHDSPQTVNCFSCHTKMTAGLGDYRLVRLGSGDDMEAQPVLKRKKKRQDGLVVGQPLSDQGACSHYRLSKRWFRFPCCHKLYPCDICHDSNEDHSYDIARRHVCGLCSREQSIVVGRPCTCGHEFEKTIHKGAFWEGGKGVRNKGLMSKKDPRKHKGIGKTTSKKQDRVGTSGKQENKK